MRGYMDMDGTRTSDESALHADYAVQLAKNGDAIFERQAQLYLINPF